VTWARNYWAEIASYERRGDHFQKTWGDGSITVSSDGMDEMIAQARVMEDCAESLAAVTATLGMCEHGIVIPYAVERGELAWSVNDYVEFAHNHRPTELTLILFGRHEERDEWCSPFAFNPAGVLYPW
jgi:hypothetical protein